MKRFVLHNRAGMEQAPLQLYCSALLFMPVMSLVRKQFVDKMPRWIKRGPEVESHWGATLQNLESDLYAVRTIAFSPSGQQLASGSADSTVRIWDVVTGATLQILEGHLDSVEAIAFLPDGKRLVSGSDDKTVRVWDVAMGVTLQVLEGHLDSVIAFALPPDNKHLVSGYKSTRHYKSTRAIRLKQPPSPSLPMVSSWRPVMKMVACS
jgi:WD40 repeat protein